jgi:hypothetical protein
MRVIGGLRFALAGDAPRLIARRRCAARRRAFQPATMVALTIGAARLALWLAAAAT